VGYNKCGELSISMQPKRKKKEEKKEEGKRRKKRFLKEVTRRREEFSESLSADTRLFIINLNTQDSTQTER
jgi:hypothetical protein